MVGIDDSEQFPLSPLLWFFFRMQSKNKDEVRRIKERWNSDARPVYRVFGFFLGKGVSQRILLFFLLMFFRTGCSKRAC